MNRLDALIEIAKILAQLRVPDGDIGSNDIASAVRDAASVLKADKIEREYAIAELIERFNKRNPGHERKP